MYKQKKALIAVFLLMITFVLYGCSTSIQNNRQQDKLSTMLKTLKNYEADVTITFLKDTQVNVLKMKQQEEVGGQYKIVVESPTYLKGHTISFDGKNITEYNPSTKINRLSQASEARNQTLFSSFLYNYLNTKEVIQEKQTLGGKEFITVEVGIPGNFKYIAKEKVWFDVNKLLPTKMEIYDTENNITIHIEFNHFKHNTKINFNT